MAAQDSAMTSKTTIVVPRIEETGEERGETIGGAKSSDSENNGNEKTALGPSLGSSQQPLKPSDLPSAPPDGGLTAWLQVLAGHLVVFNSWGYTISFGIFQPYYEDAFDLPASTISWVGSIQIFFIYLVATFSGRAYDAGHFRLVLFAGLLMQLIGIFMTSIATQFWHMFLAQGVCQGIGMGLVFAPAVANLSTWFARNRTMAISLGACGGATGGMVFPLIAQQLLTRIGFGWTVRVMGFVVLFTSSVILTVVRTRLPPRRSGPLVEWAAFKELKYALFVMSMFFSMWATYFAYYYARAYALDKLDASQSQSFTILLVISAVGIPGRLVPAFLADRWFGPLNLFIPTLVSAAVAIFAWAAVDSLGATYAWVTIFGYFGAGIQSLFPSTAATLTPDLSKNGTRLGMIFTILSVVALTGPPLAGKLIQVADGSYLGAQIWGGVCLLLGAGFLVAARMVR